MTDVSVGRSSGSVFYRWPRGVAFVVTYSKFPESFFWFVSADMREGGGVGAQWYCIIYPNRIWVLI